MECNPNGYTPFCFYLVLFFRNLILGESNELKNRVIFIYVGTV